MLRPAGAALLSFSNDGRIFLFWTALESKMISVICAQAPFPEQLLHLCANRIKLFVSRAVGILRWSFSTNFSTQLLKSLSAPSWVEGKPEYRHPEPAPAGSE
jgi:hypothetical protein